jgi:protein-arginine kinase activator protein McsA
VISIYKKIYPWLDFIIVNVSIKETDYGKIYINIDEAIKDWDDELSEDLERKEYEKYSNVQDYIEDYKITECDKKK